MINLPTFSVIIDAFNYGVYIEDAIRSVLSQTLDKKLYEVIVVDDGSTDDTRKRVEKYFPDIIYHYKNNGGQASAFNAGIAIARGEFIAFLDADDYWKADKLATVLEKFESDSEIGVVYHTLAVIDKSGNRIETFPKWFDQIISDKPVQNYDNWLTVNGSATSGITFRVSSLKQITPIPDDFKLCADGYLMACAPLAAKKFGLITTELGFYRVHGENGFAALTVDSKSFIAKSESICTHYNSLFMKYLEPLMKRLDFDKSSLSQFFQAQCFRDTVFSIKQNEGRIKAFRFFWQDRAKLYSLPLKYRLFRLSGITMRLLLPERSYFFIRKIYAQTFFWRLVNCKT